MKFNVFFSATPYVMVSACHNSHYGYMPEEHNSIAAWVEVRFKLILNHPSDIFRLLFVRAVCSMIDFSANQADVKKTLIGHVYLSLFDCLAPSFDCLRFLSSDDKKSKRKISMIKCICN